MTAVESPAAFLERLRTSLDPRTFDARDRWRPPQVTLGAGSADESGFLVRFTTLRLPYRLAGGSDRGRLVDDRRFYVVIQEDRTVLLLKLALLVSGLLCLMASAELRAFGAWLVFLGILGAAVQSVARRRATAILAHFAAQFGATVDSP